MGKIAKPFSKQAFTDPLGVFKKDKPVAPISSAPIAEPAKASSGTNELIQAGMDIQRQELMRKSVRSMVKAGDTGGYKAPGGNPMVAPQGKF